MIDDAAIDGPDSESGTWTQGDGADDAREDKGASDASDASDAADAGETTDAVAAEDAKACDGVPLSFVPSGGIDPSDLDGCGLAQVTLAAPPSDGGFLGDAAGGIDGGDARDGGDGDGGDGGDPNPADTLLDVDTGEITHAGVVLRPAATQPAGVRDVQQGVAYRINSDNVAVVTFGSLTVPAGATLKLVGSRAVALASATTIRIDGVVEARPAARDGTICTLGSWLANGPETPGATAPGGSAGGHGGFNDHYTGYDATPGSPLGLGPGGAGATSYPIGGGGGGGHAGVGGQGSSTLDAGGAGGISYDRQPLNDGSFHGGSGGGGGGGGVFAYGGFGGSGGGAVRIVAATSIEIGGGPSYGGVNASGCGGGPGARADGTSAPGGGGAGGAIVIESPRVQLDAHASLLAAGGGGGWFDGTAYVGRPGGSPSIGDTAAAAGCPWPDNSGAGGWQGPNGVSGTAQPVGCAGGGATGWIRVNAGRGGVAMTSGVILAPLSAPWFETGAIALE